jgi:DNA-binding Xre family transcriptional regulator
MARARKRALGYRWHLRRLMAEAGMFSTTDLSPLLAERGIELSAAQVYRLVTGTPERLSLRTLVALCDILGCTPTDLIEPVEEKQAQRATGTDPVATNEAASAGLKKRTPRRAEISRKK